MMKMCPTHGIDEVTHKHIFTEGLKENTKMLLDASTGGSMRVKTDQEV